MLINKYYLYIHIVILLYQVHNANAQSTSSWHVGCFGLQSDYVRTLQDYLEGSPSDNVISEYYRNYNSSIPPPINGYKHCNESGLPLVAVLSGSKFYCLQNLNHLQEAQPSSEAPDELFCSSRCADGSLPCGSLDHNYVSIYNSSILPTIYNITFSEPNQRFTHRRLQLQLTITSHHSYGLNEYLLPVHCSFLVDNTTILKDRAVEAATYDGTGLISCGVEHQFVEEGTHNISVEVVTPWETEFISRTLQLVHEIPATPDISIHLAEHELPTCISNQHELDLTEYKKAVKVYVDTPTPFKASVAQGINVTYRWKFDNTPEQIFTTDYLSCYSQCYQSFATHTFTELGVHDLAVNFTNTFGFVESTLAVIVISKDIHNVTVTPYKRVLLLGDRTDLEFSITTSTRYYTHVEIDKGDGSPLTRLSVVDRTISNMDMLLRPNPLDGYQEVISSYGVGCTLDFVHYLMYSNQEGTFNLTWTIYNNNTIINSSLPLQYSVYSRIEQLKFRGHVSYEVGMSTSITAYFSSISYHHTTLWILTNAFTQQPVYNVTGERLDTFAHIMNETGTFTLRCEVWNLANERDIGEVTLLVTEHLGSLTVSTSDDIMVTSTQQTLTFTAQLNSGLGAEFIWNVTSAGKTAVHKAPTNLGLTGKIDITFIYPDIYTVTVSARIGESSTPVRFVRRVQVYERVTHIMCRMPHRDPSGCALTAYAKTGSSVNMAFFFPSENLTQLVDADDETTVSPMQCPPVGVHKIRVVASNPISSLEIVCPLLVLPKAASVSAQLTASFNIQLEANLRSQPGGDVIQPTNAVYVWTYVDNEEKEQISVLPFIMLTNLTLNTGVEAALQVHGLNGGIRTVPYKDYAHRSPLLQHAEVVKPGESFNIYVKNLDSYSFRDLTLSAFSDSCSFNVTSLTTEYMCTLNSTNATTSVVSLSTGADSIYSNIAAVQPLPSNISIICPHHVTTSRHSQTLVSVDINGTDYQQYYAYFTWYLDGQRLAYTALPHMVYELSREGMYELKVVATNAWGNREASCQLSSTRPLIELEVKPTPVHRLNEYRLFQSFEPTAITLLVYGPTTLSNLTIDYGDGNITSFSTHQIAGFNWQYVDAAHNSITLKHEYLRDVQYRVKVSASTEDVTLHATGIVYRSIKDIDYRIIGNPHYQVNYELGDTAKLITEVGSGDYLSFEWVSDSPLQVVKTTGNSSEVTVTFENLGRPNIKCKIINPAYPEGLPVDFGVLALVVVKPANVLIHALVGNKQVDSVQLKVDPINVTFRLRYYPGPNATQVLLYGNEHDDNLQTTGICAFDNSILMTLCHAYKSRIYTKAGRYNVTMSVAVGNEEMFASMILNILPPQNVIKFVNSDKMDGDRPVYYFPFGDMAVFMIELHTSGSLNQSVRYDCLFGDQNQNITTSGNRLNVSHKYMATKEAGYTLVVNANSSGIIVAGMATVIIYKPIQRVELLARGRGWTEENQGKLYFVPEDLESDLLLVVKVYPENVPFQRCHIVKGEPQYPPAIIRTFLPENTDVTMYEYDSSFRSRIRGDMTDVKVILSAVCLEARPPNAPVEEVFANNLTIYKRRPIVFIHHSLLAEPAEEVRVGQNISYNCLGPQATSYFTHYLNGVKWIEGEGESTITFLADREGVYNLTCVASNGVNTKSVTTVVPILNNTCTLQMKILPKVSEYGEVSQWYRSEPLTLQAYFKRVRCPVKNLKLMWNITIISDGKPGAGLSLSLPDVNDLYLPPGTLDVGNYTATFIVSIPDSLFVQSTSLPFTILKTPFRAVIHGGIAREVDLTHSQILELDGSDSYDPDCMDSCVEELSFSWACNIHNTPDIPCFKGNDSNVQFGEGKKAFVNTSLLLIGADLSYNFVLVVFRPSEAIMVVAQQIWHQLEVYHMTDVPATRTLSVKAKCETCIDGQKRLSSPSRPIVFRAVCPLADCDNVRYTWHLSNVPSATAVKLDPVRDCSPVEAVIIVPQQQPSAPPPATTPATTLTPVTISSTTIPSGPGFGGGGLGPFPPAEEGSGNEGGRGGTALLPPYLIPFEGGFGASTTASSLFEDLDYSQTQRFGPQTSRRPRTTTMPTTSAPTDGAAFLPECTPSGGACAQDPDIVISYNATIYEVSRVEVRLDGNTIGDLNSKDLIIKPDILKPLGSYIVKLQVESGPSIGLGYYLLNTGDEPSHIACYPSFSKRHPNGSVHAYYDFETDGEELTDFYEYGCSVKDDKEKRPDRNEYSYSFEVYMERVPGELELILLYRKYVSDVTGPQRLPAGFPEYNHQVNIQIIAVDVYGNRQYACLQPHRVLPKNYTARDTANDAADDPAYPNAYPSAYANANGTAFPAANTTASKTATEDMYDLVDEEGAGDWYDKARTNGDAFAQRTNILAVCEVLNRAAGTETDEGQIKRRMEIRSRLLSQLFTSPHRFTAEVEQKLLALRSIVKIKEEVDENSTMKSMDLLSDLVKAFIDYSPKDRPRNVTATARVVLAISSQLMRCVSSLTSETLRNTYSDSRKLDNAINSILMESLNAGFVPTAKHIVSAVNGMTIVSRRYIDIDISDETISHGNVSFRVPAKLIHELEEIQDCYSANMMQYPVNPFKAGIDSVVTSLVLFDCGGNEVKDVKTNSNDAHIQFTLPSLTDQTEVSSIDYQHSIHKENINVHLIHQVPTRHRNRSLNLIFDFEEADGHTFPIVILIRKDHAPTPHDYDKLVGVHSQASQLQLFLYDHEVGSASKVYVAVADANFNAGKPRKHEVKDRNYTMLSWWSECVYWNTETYNWSGEGCSVTQDTTLTMTGCSCSHLTAFASKREATEMEVYKERVSKYFQMKYYPTTVVMVCVCVLTYIVLAIVSYVADRKSPVQERVIPIQDNSPSDKQRYIITLETGSEPGSGTSAKVSLVLHGEEGMSETRELIGSVDCQVFQANSRDTFLLTLPACLGPIWKVQLWHDNKGSTPSWYVKRVTVRDIENGQSYYFLCERWLAVEERDGKVEREFMALDSHIGFGVVFKVKAPQYFNDYHLIRSLVYKPTYSHFSRVERLTCVFVGLLAHMALCTAYYDAEVEEYRGQYNLFDLSSRTVLVSLVVNVVACPLMLALSMIFRRSSVGGRSAFKFRDSKKHRLSSKMYEGGGVGGTGQSPEPPLPGSHSMIEQSILRWQSLQQWAQKQWEKRYQKALLAGEELNTVEMQMQEQVLTLASTQSGSMFSAHADQSKMGSQCDVKRLITHSDTDSTTVSSQGSSSVHSFVKSRRYVLPPWFRFVAWFLSFVCASGCGFITIYYSYEFQEGRFVLWLQSIFVTFLFCNFLIQPFGILMKAVGTAIIYRRDPTVLQHFPDRYEEDIEEIRIRSTFMSDEDEITRGTRARQRSRYLRFARPPQEKQLIAARKRTMKEKKLARLGAECAVLSLLLVLVVVIVFCEDRDESFHLNANIRSLVATNPLTARHQSFVNISKPSDMWNWLQHDLPELLFSNHSTNLGASLIIGNASRIKQVRVQKELCEARNHMPKWTMRDTCSPPYSVYTIDRKPMLVNNQTVQYVEVDSHAQSILHGKLTQYTGSGYDILLPTTEQPFLQALRDLQSSRWLDRQSRAVFVEFTLYNIPSHLYSSVTAFFELSPSGQVLPQLEVDSARLYRYRSTGGYVVLTCELLFIFVYLCQLHFHIVTMMQMRKKYFTQIWNILETLYLLLAIAYIVLYLYRFEIVEMLHNELMQTFHSSFVSVAPLVFWDSLVRLLLGLLLFILLVKILKLFRYVKTCARLGNVYRRASQDIWAFAAFFLLLIIIYTNLGVSLFQPVALPFSDYWRGVMTVAGYFTGAVNFKDFNDADPILGGIYIIIVRSTGGGVLLALMVSILSYHLRDFSQDPILAMDIKEAFSFLWKKFFRSSNKSKEKEEDDSDSQVLSPEFALAEMEYQADELLFKMSALCDGVSLPHKSNMHYTTTESDGTYGLPGEDILSMGGSGGSGGRDKVDDVSSLSRLLHLQSIGTEMGDGQHMYSRSQLEMDVLRQLHMSHPRDAGINVWDDLRGVSIDRPFSDDPTSDTDIPIHRAEYNNPVIHSYQGDDDEAFINIPDESHTTFAAYSPTPPPGRRRKKEKERKHKEAKSEAKQTAQAEVYELAEHPRALTPEISYHNDAYLSDVEVEVEVEFTPSPVNRVKGFSRKSKSSKSKSAYQNAAYHEDEEDHFHQTDV